MTHHMFSDVDRFTVGTVGDIGARVFMLQLAVANQQMTLKLEKQQVAALAAYFGRVLQDLPSPGHLPEELDLQDPAEPEWVIGSIGVTYDADLDRIVVELEEADFDREEDAPANEDANSARVFVTREQAAAIAIHGTQLVASGRPPCPLCGHPIDPSGHACPKTNGYRAPAP